jgi:hypothetical protein
MRAAFNVTTTVHAYVYSDGGATPATLIADLGIQPVDDSAYYTLTFIPSGTVILEGGQRYWFILDPNSIVAWYGHATPVEPTGIFSLVGYRYNVGALWNNITSGYYAMAIDADPTASPPSTGGNGVPGPTCANMDNRLNSVCLEPWQTAAIYCERGDIHVYGIGENSDGYLLFVTSADEINTIGIPDENTMIESSHDSRVRLYRLPSGEFQVNSPIVDDVRGFLPNGYAFRWDGGCP